MSALLPGTFDESAQRGTARDRICLYFLHVTGDKAIIARDQVVIRVSISFHSMEYRVHNYAEQAYKQALERHWNLLCTAYSIHRVST